MKSLIKTRIVMTALVVFLVHGLPASADNAAIESALASDARTDDERARDARSKPEAILGLLDLQPGQSVVDIFGGGGYYSVLVADIVGPGGNVVLHNNTPYSSFVEKIITARFVENEVSPVTLLKSEVDDLQLGEASFDAALMVMSYHDLYQYNPKRGWHDTDVPAFFAQVNAALKPGGKLLIVDHSAQPGTGDSAAQDIHRIDEEYAKQDIAQAGFKLVATSDALRHPEDDRTKMVFDKSIRGQTDRFVLLFEKE